MTTPSFGESYRNQFMEPRFQNPFLDYLEGSTEGQFGIFQSVAQPFATERRKRETNLRSQREEKDIKKIEKETI